MASNTCTDLIIHPEYLIHHLNATHSNISFGIELRNLANKRSSFLEQIFVAQPSHENSTEPDFMITSDSDDENEQVMSGLINEPLSSSSPFVLESIHDSPYIASSQPISETSIIHIPRENRRGV